MKKIIKLVLWIFAFQVIGYSIGLLTQHDILIWYPNLHKSTLNPPNIVFPIVWSVLYVMLAIAGWSIWNKPVTPEVKRARLFFSLQMIMNWMWTPIFFNFHWIHFAFYWLIAIIIFTIITVIYTNNKSFLATCMLIPYLAWLLFAAYLNGVIAYLN